MGIQSRAPVSAMGVLPTNVQDPFAAASLLTAAGIPPGVAAAAAAQVLPRHISQINGKPKIAHMTRTGSGRKQVISWMDAPDDLYFRATDTSRKVRKQIPSNELRRIARKPWRASPRHREEMVVVLDD